MNLSLFDLNKAYRDFMELVERREGEISEAQDSDLATLETALISKADSCAFVLDKLAAEADFYKAQSDRLLAYAKTCKNAHERLKVRILEAVKVSPDRTIQGETIAFGVKLNPPALVIAEGAEVPEKFKVVEVVIDKASLKDAVKNGLEVPGVSLVQGESLQIKRPKK